MAELSPLAEARLTIRRDTLRAVLAGLDPEPYVLAGKGVWHETTVREVLDVVRDAVLNNIHDVEKELLGDEVNRG